jgi:hypothetical protein
MFYKAQIFSQKRDLLAVELTPFSIVGQNRVEHPTCIQYFQCMLKRVHLQHPLLWHLQSEQPQERELGR